MSELPRSERQTQIDDIQPLIAEAASISGDIAPDKLAAATEVRNEAHFSRWDINI